MLFNEAAVARCDHGVVSALVGLSGVVLVEASPGGLVQPVNLVRRGRLKSVFAAAPLSRLRGWRPGMRLTRQSAR